MVKHVLGSIDGVGSFGAAAVLLFFIVFVSVIIRLMLYSRTEIDELSALPLDGEFTSEKEAL
jgi:hypothetical protein